MRRLLCLTLLVLFSSSLIAPLFASDEASSLPACCRRNGAHHCVGMGSEMERHDGPSLTVVHARCPSFPAAARSSALERSPLAVSQRCFAEIIAHPSGQPQTQARYRISFSRARQKRGPPTILTSPV